MPRWIETASPTVTVLRVAAIVGFALTLVGAAFVFVYASLVEGSYEAAVRSEPWEWAVAASLVGAIAVAFASYGIAVCSRSWLRFGAGVQAIAVLVVLTVAFSDFGLRGSEFECAFITLASLAFLFDGVVFVASWALKPPHRAA